MKACSQSLILCPLFQITLICAVGVHTWRSEIICLVHIAPSLLIKHFEFRIILKDNLTHLIQIIYG